MGITQCESRLSTYLFGKTRRALLALLFGRPDQSFYVNELVQTVGAGTGAVQRELGVMADAGIVTRERRGNLLYYQANHSSPIFQEIRAIVRKTFGIADVLRESLATLQDRIRAAFVFGSIAGGTERRASDVDIMVVGDVSFGEVVSCLSEAEKTLQREVNPVVYPVPEFRNKARTGHHFVKAILEGKKLFIVGDEHELAGLAE